MSFVHHKQYPVYTVQFWKAYFIQMRPYLLFVSGAAGAAGIAMSKADDTPDWRCWLAFIPFFLGYGFGQALTDCFQTDTDKLSAPYRPLSQGIISVRAVMTVSISGLLASGLILAFLHPVSFWLSLLSVMGLATYSYIKKHFWFGGPFHNAWIVALLPVMGYFTNLPSAVKNFPLQFIPIVIITFSSYASFVLIGYLKDIDADKATNYKTFPVIFGWNKTVSMGHLLALTTLAVFWWRVGNNLWEWLFGISASVFIIIGQAMAHRSKLKNEKDALIPILSTVRSFILFHIAIMLHFQPGWLIATFPFYCIFEWSLAKRPSRYQV